MSVTETITTSLAGLVEETLKDPARPQGVAIDRAKMHALAQQIKTALETDPELQDIVGDYALAVSQKEGNEQLEAVLDKLVKRVDMLDDGVANGSFHLGPPEQETYAAMLRSMTKEALMAKLQEVAVSRQAGKSAFPPLCPN